MKLGKAASAERDKFPKQFLLGVAKVQPGWIMECVMCRSVQKNLKIRLVQRSLKAYFRKLYAEDDQQGSVRGF